MSDEQKEIEKQERRERYLKSKAAKTTPPRSNLSDKSPAKSTKYNALSKIKKLLPSNDKTTTYVLKQLVKVSTPSKKKKVFEDLARFFKFKSKGGVSKRVTKTVLQKKNSY